LQGENDAQHGNRCEKINANSATLPMALGLAIALEYAIEVLEEHQDAYGDAANHECDEYDPVHFYPLATSHLESRIPDTHPSVRSTPLANERAMGQV